VGLDIKDRLKIIGL